MKKNVQIGVLTGMLLVPGAVAHAFDDSQKSFVENYEAVTGDEAALEVKNKIDSLAKMTANSAEFRIKVSEARKAYDDLVDQETQVEVTYLETLKEMEQGINNAI
ncbi:MAG: hypothetical protein RR588_11425, partial [Solibacillus sp.]